MSLVVKQVIHILFTTPGGVHERSEFASTKEKIEMTYKICYSNLEVVHMKKTIKVVGAIIENHNNEILCALRSPEMNMPNLWEFPGGKVEENESLAQAILREIQEELKCSIEFKEMFNNNTHEYDNVIVNLITLKCKLVEGAPIATEHSKLIWLKRENLQSLKWAPADVSAVDQLIKEKSIVFSG